MGIINNIINFINVWDLIIISSFTLFFAFFIFFIKKEKAMILILSIYLSFVFVEEFNAVSLSLLRWKFFSSNIFIPEILFVIIIILFFILFLRTGFFKSYARSYYQKDGKQFFLNILAIILFVNISIHYFLPPYIGLNLSLFLKIVFTNPLMFFIWMSAPMFSLFFVRR
ncbi:MAG: hypothetical protein GWO87_00565 [Xanthomonadaceae bacterium]|nr:hypothetical protein [Rhodospirillaceae bacterium]NIA17673.1 hypothetical protein [Xanthomonadaceae bacterium]